MFPPNYLAHQTAPLLHISSQFGQQRWMDSPPWKKTRMTWSSMDLKGQDPPQPLFVLVLLRGTTTQATWQIPTQKMTVQGATRVSLLSFLTQCEVQLPVQQAEKSRHLLRCSRGEYWCAVGQFSSSSRPYIYRTFHTDMRRKGQWKMDRIALPVYHLAKFVHERVKEQSRTRLVFILCGPKSIKKIASWY